jgi:transcriptional regulator GlxA family with amidase domain
LGSATGFRLADIRLAEARYYNRVFNVKGGSAVRIALLVPPGAHGLEIAGIGEVFDEANRQIHGPPAYELVRVAAETAPIRCSCGLTILPDCALGDAGPVPDTLIIGASYGIPDRLPPAMRSWVQTNAAQARRFGAVCTGAFALGEAGLLNGRRVTTHWEYATELARRFPGARLEPDRIFIRDGAMFTSAGVTAALDLALDLVEEDLGRQVALAVARRLVIFMKRPGGQTQYSVHLSAQVAQSEPVQRAQDLVRRHPTANLSMATLAHQAGTSQRNLARLFRQETGMSVGEYVEATRLDLARDLLEGADLSIKRVAVASGFSSPEALRRAFAHRLGVTPTEYRARFRSPRST